jgi:hypothetical protein
VAELRGALERVRMQSEGFVGAAGPMAVEPIVGGEDRLSMAVADHKGFAAPPACLGAAIGQIWHDLSHVIAPSE